MQGYRQALVDRIAVQTAEGSAGVSGVALCPEDNLAVACTSDGSLSLLELRKGGACLAR